MHRHIAIRAVGLNHLAVIVLTVVVLALTLLTEVAVMGVVALSAPVRRSVCVVGLAGLGGAGAVGSVSVAVADAAFFEGVQTGVAGIRAI